MRTTHAGCTQDGRGALVRSRAFSLLLAALLGTTLMAPAGPATPDAMPARELVDVIVRSAPGAGAEARATVADLGGLVGRTIGIIHGFTATVPADVMKELRSSAVIHSISPDAQIRLFGSSGGRSGGGAFDARRDAGSLLNTRTSIGADYLLHKGLTGKGVDIALIDSGVVPVNGLTSPGKVIEGPDLSFESQAESLRYLDTYGHGTHMAGIIAGKDDGADGSGQSDKAFTGIAPDARLVSVKVASATGATDVSQVLAAIDWVVQHRTDNGMNVRVLNLSFGTDGTQDYTVDPLTYAVEVAWRKGIVVVAAGGNAGYGSPQLNNPAYDPYLLAVGADDAKGTLSTSDDVVPDWSSRGDGRRNPDLVAPGKSIVSLRDPGSEIDLTYPEGRVGDRFFRGSGTSQAAAVVSGAAALLLQQRPGLTPDQVKALLTSTATQIPGADPLAQGAGLLNLKAAYKAKTPAAIQSWPPSSGTGSLEAARGSSHVEMEGVPLDGEQDIFGTPWDGATWARNSWSGTSWDGGMWNGEVWSGSGWTRNSWSRNSWSTVIWSRNSWSRNSWSDGYWSRNSWSGSTWTGDALLRNSWSADSWSRNSWSRNSWSSAGWGDQ